MLELDQGWQLEMERGPDWLFVRLDAASHAAHPPADLAESIWRLLRQHFTNRLVLEMDDLPILCSELIGQMVILHKRIYMDGGLMRVCGLSEGHRLALRSCRISDRFPSYRNREDAVMGHRPALPR